MAKQLALQDSAESLIYQGLCYKLKNDPVLKRVINQWAFWLDDFDLENVNTLPYLSFSPNSSNDAVKETYQNTSAMLRLDIEMIVPGTDGRDMLNLWQAVRNALFPGDGTVATLLNTNVNGATNGNCGVDMWIEKAPTGIGEIEGERNMVATGTVVVRMFINSGL